MPYKMTYSVSVEWVGAGTGPIGNMRQAQTYTMQKSAANNNVTVQTFVTGDVTTLCNALSSDISAQLNVAPTLAMIAAWATGGN